MSTLWDKKELTPYPALEGAARVEVAIVGAGITGLTAARLLVARGKRVAVLEQDRVGFGTAGTAHVSQVSNRRYTELVSKLGRDAVRQMVESTRSALERIDSFIQEDSISCDYARIPAWLYTESERNVSRLQEEVDAAREVGMPAIFTREIPLPFSTAAAVRLDSQARLHPLAYLGGLAARVVDEGGRIHEQTCVVNVEGRGPFRMETERGTVTADTVLVADRSDPAPAGFSLMTELEPLRSHVLGVRLRNQEPPDGLFFDTRDPYIATRRQPDDGTNILIVGGGESDRALEEYVRRRWHVESIPYRWSTQLQEPPDGLPRVGESPTRSHIFVAAGGSGMVFGTAGGMLLAGYALERVPEWAEVYLELEPARR